MFSFADFEVVFLATESDFSLIASHGRATMLSISAQCVWACFFFPIALLKMETEESAHATVSSRSPSPFSSPSSSPPTLTPAAALAWLRKDPAICNLLGSLVSLFTRSGSRDIDRWVRSESLGRRGVRYKRLE